MITISIYNLDNDAMQDPSEIPRILRDLADRVEMLGAGEALHEFACPLRDSNGNTVGLASYEERQGPSVSLDPPHK